MLGVKHGLIACLPMATMLPSFRLLTFRLKSAFSRPDMAAGALR